MAESHLLEDKYSDRVWTAGIETHCMCVKVRPLCAGPSSLRRLRLEVILQILQMCRSKDESYRRTSEKETRNSHVFQQE